MIHMCLSIDRKKNKRNQFVTKKGAYRECGKIKKLSTFKLSRYVFQKKPSKDIIFKRATVSPRKKTPVSKIDLFFIVSIAFNFTAMSFYSCNILNETLTSKFCE